MRGDMLHVFRNSPFGREVFLQSLYIAQRAKYDIKVLVPTFRSFLMYFRQDVVTVDLSREFLQDPETAREHAQALADTAGLEIAFLDGLPLTASVVPSAPVDLSMMCCPRSMSDLSNKIGIGRIGAKVRAIIRFAPFPVLLASTCHRQWHRLVVLFGGSPNSRMALRFALRLRRACGLPVTLMTFLDTSAPKEELEEALARIAREHRIEPEVVQWTFLPGRSVRDELYAVPHDALVVAGAYGHGAIQEVLFGGLLELVQSVLPNPLVIVGPEYDASLQL